MTKISAYPEIAVPTTDDLLIGTDVETQNQTKNFSIQSVIDLVTLPTLQEVCNAGATVIDVPIIIEAQSPIQLAVYCETEVAISGQSGEGIGIKGNTSDGYGVYGIASNGIGIWGTCTDEGGAIVADGGASGLGTGLNVLNGGVNILGAVNPVSGYQLKLSANSAAKPSTNTWTITSDERVKTNVNPYTKGLEAILSINPITYDYNGKAGFEQLTNNIGIIAQDVLNIMPECINTYKAKLNEDDEEYTELYNFDSHALTFALINAVKELKAEIEILKAK